ncbi:MAG: hypothetical protein ACR2NR_17210 [Solirubrobacteraceae bacterium]
MPVGNGSPSHIVSARVPDAESLISSLEAAGIRALALGDRLRVGFHYFNDERDVDAVLGARPQEGNVGATAPSVAVVTGADNGIGEACVRELTTSGYHAAGACFRERIGG